MTSASAYLAMDLSINLRAFNQYFVLSLSSNEDILICHLLTLQNNVFCQSQIKGFRTFYNHKWGHQTCKYLYCYEFKVGEPGIKCPTGQTSGETSPPMVTLYTYVWTYSKTRQIHTHRNIQTGPCHPKQNSKQILSATPIKNLYQ